MKPIPKQRQTHTARAKARLYIAILKSDIKQWKRNIRITEASIRKLEKLK